MIDGRIDRTDGTRRLKYGQRGEQVTERARFPVVVHVLFSRQVAGTRELCLFRRSNTGFMDGWFTLPGGHQEHGETLQEAAMRECMEEVGVRPRELVPVAALGYQSRGHQGLNFIFRCDSWGGELCLAEPVFDQMVCVTWLEDVLVLEAQGRWLKEIRYS